MKINFHKLLFAIAHLFIFSQISAHFCAGSIWYKDDTQNKRHWIYLLGDSHYANHLAGATANLMRNGVQIPDWKNRLNELKKYIAIEQNQAQLLDIYITSNKKADSTIILLEGHPTDNLTQQFQKVLDLDKEDCLSIIHTINKTCTSVTREFIDPRYDSDGRYVYDFSSHFTFPLSNQQREKLEKMFYDRKEMAIKQFTSLIEKHAGNPEFQKYSTHTYETCLKQSANVLHALQDNRMETSQEYYNHTMSEGPSKLYRELLDVSIIHHILDNFEKEHIFVCCGNKHREAINRGLGGLGYSIHYTETDTFIHKAGDGRYFDETKPLDIKNFLQQQQAQLQTPPNLPEQQRPQNQQASSSSSAAVRPKPVEQTRVVSHQQPRQPVVNPAPQPARPPQPQNQPASSSAVRPKPVEQTRVVSHQHVEPRPKPVANPAPQRVAPMPAQPPQQQVPSQSHIEQPVNPVLPDVGKTPAPSGFDHSFDEKEPSNSSFINSFFFWTSAGLLATAAVYGIYWLYANNSIGGK